MLASRNGAPPPVRRADQDSSPSSRTVASGALGVGSAPARLGRRVLAPGRRDQRPIVVVGHGVDVGAPLAGTRRTDPPPRTRTPRPAAPTPATRSRWPWAPAASAHRTAARCRRRSRRRWPRRCATCAFISGADGGRRRVGRSRTRTRRRTPGRRGAWRSPRTRSSGVRGTGVACAAVGEEADHHEHQQHPPGPTLQRRRAAHDARTDVALLLHQLRQRVGVDLAGPAQHHHTVGVDDERLGHLGHTEGDVDACRRRRARWASRRRG